jgi:hypothetical protein
MSATSTIKTGFFVIADISGYTSFLTGTEADHAQAIVEELTKLILDHIKPPFKLVKLEGDAVFYYAQAEMFPEAERFFEHMEACYCDFIGHILKVQRLSNCQCRACSSMQTLDLKFFAHYGEYMTQKMRGTADDIVGRDVILVHRLLKNSVTDKMGLRGYALLTKACLKQIGKFPSLTPHSETYDHIGEVACEVYNLRDYEQRLRETRRVYLEPHDADYIFERIVKTSPELLWSFVIDPQRRLQWQTIKEVKNIRNDSGRMGVDAEFHCDHGAFTRVTHMLDWRPFHYMTNTTVQTFHQLPVKGPPCQGIYEFIPIDAEHTKLSFRLRCLRRDWFTMQLVRLFMKRTMDKEYEADFNRLDKVLAEMQDSVSIDKVKPISDVTQSQV